MRKLEVQRHARGIRIVSGDARESAAAASRLRRTYHIDVPPLPERGYLVAQRFAAFLLESLPPPDAEWDPEALMLAQVELGRRDEQAAAKVAVAEAVEHATTVLADYDKVGLLDKHQVEAVAAISVPSLVGMAIFDEQGAGKTIMALCGFDRLRRLGRVERLLVICPKSVIESWQRDTALLFSTDYRIRVVVGTKARRRKLMLSDHDVLIVTYEGAVSDLTVLRLLLSGRPGRYMLVIDESYFVKNPDTARARAIAELSPHCERTILLCGTPAPNAPHDIVNQVSIADGGIAFANTRVPKDRDAAEPVVQEALEDFIYLRRLKADVLPGLPQKGFERVSIDLRPTQRALYERARADLILAVRTVDDREFTRRLGTFMSRRLALLQICSHPGGLDPLYSEEPAKLLALDRLIREIVEERRQKVVIWSFFRYSLQAIADRYSPYGLARIDGTVPSVRDRLDAIRRFQNDPGVPIFLGNAAAAGAGITLTAAHHAVYESFSNQAAHYVQSLDRIHRRGQTERVTYHVLLARDTVEEPEFERLLRKERAAHDLLGDLMEWPVTRDRFLLELEGTRALE